LTTLLIAAPGRVERGGPRALGTPPGAVAIAAITVAAEEEHLAALGPSADHEPKGIHASLRTGRRGGQSRPGVRSQSRAGSRVPVWDSARGPGVVRLRALTLQLVGGTDLPQHHRRDKPVPTRSRFPRLLRGINILQDGGMRPARPLLSGRMIASPGVGDPGGSARRGGTTPIGTHHPPSTSWSTWLRRSR